MLFLYIRMFRCIVLFSLGAAHYLGGKTFIHRRRNRQLDVGGFSAFHGFDGLSASDVVVTIANDPLHLLSLPTTGSFSFRWIRRDDSHGSSERCDRRTNPSSPGSFDSVLSWWDHRFILVFIL